MSDVVPAFSLCVDGNGRNLKVLQKSKVWVILFIVSGQNVSACQEISLYELTQQAGLKIWRNKTSHGSFLVFY